MLDSGFARLKFLEALARARRPDPQLTVSEWADLNRRLTGKSASEPGPWRTSRVPFMREIMDCLSAASPIERVSFMKGTQIGASESGNNWIGYCIMHSPGPMLVVQPTVETAKRFSKQRLAPLLEETPELSALVRPPRERDSGNTLLTKEFPGGVLILTGANSAVGLRSMPAARLFLDEVDAYDSDVNNEGDPVDLAWARSQTFWRRKMFLVSTPKLSGISRIEREFEAGDQRRYFVPCPHCGHMQTLEWEQLKWPSGEPGKAKYECIECKRPIGEEHKTRMLADAAAGGRAEWRPTTECDPKIRSYHISSLYSPVGWKSWTGLAEDWIKAQGSPTNLKAFVNTKLGKPWVERGERPDYDRLWERRETYERGVVPAGGLVLTAGVDVQADRLECEVVAWGKYLESWSVDYVVIRGEPGREQVWSELEKQVLGKIWMHERGAEMRIARMAVDTGHLAPAVYAWRRRLGDSRVLCIKGYAGLPAPIGRPNWLDINWRGARIKRGVQLYMVGTNYLKSELYAALRKPLPDEGEIEPGFCHFPQYDREYFKQLTAEQLVTTKGRGGYPKREWQKAYERNEALDVRNYARAALSHFGADRWADEKWDQLAKAMGIVSEASDGTQPQETPDDMRPQGKVQSGWLGGGRNGGGWLK